MISIERRALWFAGGLLLVCALPAQTLAQYTGPPLLGDSLAVAVSASVPAPIGEVRTQPFEVQSVGKVAPRLRRAAAVLGDAPAAPRSVAAVPPAAAPSSTPGSTGGAAIAPAVPAAPAPPTVGATPPALASSAPAGPPASGRTHRVEWGETWLGIARQYGVTDSTLRAVNPGVDPERIRSGQVLRVPVSGSAAAQRSHRVVAGETLSALARRYDVSVEAIRAANRLADDQVRVGQTLVIPGGGR
jgi:LysM repeat protein